MKSKLDTTLEKPSRKERRKEMTRDLILNAAETIFSQKGLSEATMDQIADQAALSKGSLYNYFTSKDDLEIALAARSYEKLTALFSDAIDPQISGLEQFGRSGWAFYQFDQDYPIYSQILHTVNVSPTVITQSVVQESPNYADLITKIQQFITVWTGAVQRGLDDGSIHSTLDAMSLAIIVSMITSGMIDQIGRRELLLGQLQMDGKSILQIVFDWIYKGLREE